MYKRVLKWDIHIFQFSITKILCILCKAKEVIIIHFISFRYFIHKFCGYIYYFFFSITTYFIFYHIRPKVLFYFYYDFFYVQIIFWCNLIFWRKNTFFFGSTIMGMYFIFAFILFWLYLFLTNWCLYLLTSILLFTFISPLIIIFRHVSSIAFCYHYCVHYYFFPHCVSLLSFFPYHLSSSSAFLCSPLMNQNVCLVRFKERFLISFL